MRWGLLIVLLVSASLLAFFYSLAIDVDLPNRTGGEVQAPVPDTLSVEAVVPVAERTLAESAITPEVQAVASGAAWDADTDWPSVAGRYVAETSVVGDPFHEVLLRFLSAAAEDKHEPVRIGAGNSTLANAVEAEKNTGINPLGLKLSESDQQSLDSLIGEYKTKMRMIERDLNITYKLCASKSLARGDYLVYPANTDKINQRISEDLEAEFEKPSNINYVCLPAPNGLIRVVALKPATSPEYYSVLTAQRRLQAEHAVALRMFFIPEGR